MTEVSLHIPDPSFPLERLNLGEVSLTILKGWTGDVPKTFQQLVPRYMWQENVPPASVAELAAELHLKKDPVLKALMQIYARRLCFALLQEKIHRMTEQFTKEHPGTMAMLMSASPEQPLAPLKLQKIFDRFSLQLEEPADVALLRNTHTNPYAQEVLHRSSVQHADPEFPLAVIWMFRSGVVRTLSTETHRAEGEKDLMSALVKVQTFLTHELQWGEMEKYLLP